MKTTKPAKSAPAIYARISTDRSGERSNIERQLAACQLKATELGVTVEPKHVYQDNDISASSSKRRPGWEQLIGEIVAGKIDTIIVWHIDRVYRRTTELDRLIKISDAHPVKIIAVASQQLDLETEMGRAIGMLSVTIAQYESGVKSERLRSKHAEIARQKKHHGGGRRPLGYNSRRWNNGQEVIYQPEARVLRKAAKMLVGGATLYAVTRYMSKAWPWETHLVDSETGRRVPQEPTKRQFSTYTVRRALTAPHIAGIRSHLPVASRCKGDLRPELHPGAWPAVLSKDLYKSVCEVFEARQREAARLAMKRGTSKELVRVDGMPGARKHLLSGLLRCAVCGATLGKSSGGTSRPLKRRSDVGTVRLSAPSPGAYTCPHSHVGVTARIESAVIAMFIVSAPQALNEAMRAVMQASETGDDSTEIDAWRIEIDALDRRATRLVDLYEADLEMTINEYKFRKAGISTDREIYQRKLDDHLAAEQRATELLASVPVVFRDTSVDRTALSALIDHIVVAPSANGRRSGKTFDPSRLSVFWRSEPYTAYAFGEVPASYKIDRQAQPRSTRPRRRRTHGLGEV